MEEAELPRSGLTPLRDGLWFISEAAADLARQQSMEFNGRQDLARRMAECANLAAAHPHYLRTRHLESRLLKAEGEANGITLGVYPADVNAWLHACGVPYQWTPDGEVTYGLAGQRPPMAEQRKKQEPPPGLAKAVAETDGLTRRESQIRAIIAMAELEGLNPLQIPTGKKAKLMQLCKKEHPGLFGAGNDPFKDAWKSAGPGRLCMADRSKFARR